jgi:hypothetical protein
MAKRGAGSRRKGAASEREMVREFRRAFGGEWARSKVGYAQHDISAPDDFPFAIEVKNHDTITTRHFFSPTSLLKSFWTQTKEQAEKVKKEPMLCVNADRHWYAIVLEGAVIETVPCAITNFDNDRVSVMPLDAFLDNAGGMYIG